MKRLTGAVLYARVIKNCEAYLADYGLPMHYYKGEVSSVYDLGSDMQPILSVIFTHKGNGVTIKVTNIHPGNP